MAECPHTGLVYEAQANNKHGGTCPICGTEVSEEHTWVDGTCEVCNLKAVAEVETSDGTTIYLGESDFANAFDDTKYNNVIVTLLADIQSDSIDMGGTHARVHIFNTCILDLAGHTITGSDTTIYIWPLGNLTIMDSSSGKTGQVVSNGGAAILTQTDMVSLTGGTYTGNPTIDGKDSSTNVSSLLANYGTQAMPHYAYFDTQGNPVALGENQRELTGTVTVKECTHPGVKASPNNNGTHSINCSYCGYTGTAENCAYAFSENVGTCPDCKDTLTVEVDTAPLTYNGNEQKPGVTVKRGETVLTEGYTVTYANNKNAGNDTASVTVSGTGWSYTQNFSIKQATLTIKATDQEITYGQSITQETDQVTATGLCPGDSLASITLAASSAQVAEADKTITPSDAVIQNASNEDVTGNYSIKYETGSLTINKADQEAPAAPSAADANIKDSSITLTTIDGAEYRMGEDGEWKDSPIFTGLEPNHTYTFYARLKGDDNKNTSPASGGTTITTKKTMLDNAVVTVSGTYTYDGTAQVPSAEQVKVKLNGTEIPSGQYTISASSNINADEATVTITATADSDYSGTASGKFTIARARLTITASNQTITYGGSITQGTNQVTVATLCGSDALESVALTASTKNVPGGTITPSDAVIKNSGEDVTGNYEISYQTGTLTINKSTPTIAFDSGYDPSKTYDGQTIADPVADNLNITGAGVRGCGICLDAGWLHRCAAKCGHLYPHRQHPVNGQH